jgi:pyrimidine-specific ribonucleoside hydrolase
VAALALIVTSCANGASTGEPTTGADFDTTTSSVPTAGDAPIPVVLDGDFGPDDMMALLYLVQAPDVELLAVTVSGTGLVHCPQGAVNAEAILAYVEHDDVPVACGQSEPLAGTNAFPEEWRVGADQLAQGLGIATTSTVADRQAVDLLIETIEGSDRPVHLLVLGPMTNIAAALGERPQIVDNLARIVAMGGALEVNGSVAPSYTAEWNLWVDPVAANMVLRSGVPMLIVPLDATNEVPATIFFYEATKVPRATAAADLVYKFFTRNRYNLEGGSYFFWDPLAAMTLVEAGVVTTEARKVTVMADSDDLHGALIESPDGVEVQVAIAADRRLFEERFLSTLNGGADVPVEIPVPQVTIRYTGSTCTFDGPKEFDAQGPVERVIVELINETETPVSVASSLHEGLTWEQVVADAAEYERTGRRPPYWQQTGTVSLFGRSVTGGQTVGPLDLTPGTHALVCASSDGGLFPLTDLVIVGTTAG